MQTNQKIGPTPEKLASSGTEDGEQTALFCEAAERARGAPLWTLLYAVPNGGRRDPATAARLRATGVKKGFPDIGLPVARGEFHGLFIELKRRAIIEKTQRAGRIAVEQDMWHIKLRAQGYCVSVCYGWEHACKTIEIYLGM